MKACVAGTALVRDNGSGHVQAQHKPDINFCHMWSGGKSRRQGLMEKIGHCKGFRSMFSLQILVEICSIMELPWNGKAAPRLLPQDHVWQKSMSGLGYQVGNLTRIYVPAKAAMTLCSHGDPTHRVFIVNSNPLLLMRECMSHLIYALGGELSRKSRISSQNGCVFWTRTWMSFLGDKSHNSRLSPSIGPFWLK